MTHGPQNSSKRPGMPLFEDFYYISIERLTNIGGLRLSAPGQVSVQLRGLGNRANPRTSGRLCSGRDLEVVSKAPKPRRGGPTKPWATPRVTRPLGRMTSPEGAKSRSLSRPFRARPKAEMPLGTQAVGLGFVSSPLRGWVLKQPLVFQDRVQVVLAEFGAAFEEPELNQESQAGDLSA